MAELRREIQIVQDDNHGLAVRLVLTLEQVEDLDLVTQIQVGGRLVEEQDVGLLGESPGDHCPLSLAAAQLTNPAVGMLQQVRAREGVRGEVEVGPFLHLEAPKMRRSAHENDFEDGELEGHLAVLGHDGDPPSQIAPANRGDTTTVERYRAARGPKRADHRLEESGLAGPVRADDADELADVDVKADVPQDVG